MTVREDPEYPEALSAAFDALAVMADDDLLDALGSGTFVPSVVTDDGQIAATLAAWRRALEDAVTILADRDAGGHDALAAGPLPTVAAAAALRRIGRLRRGAIAGATAMAVVAGGGVAAAAISGPLGGVHRLLYRSPAPAPARTDPATAEIDAVLRAADSLIAAGRRVGAITPTASRSAISALDRAARLLARQASPDQGQLTRLAGLRAALAALPRAVAGAPDAPTRHPGPVGHVSVPSPSPGVDGRHSPTERSTDRHSPAGTTPTAIGRTSSGGESDAESSSGSGSASGSEAGGTDGAKSGSGSGGGGSSGGPDGGSSSGSGGGGSEDNSGSGGSGSDSGRGSSGGDASGGSGGGSDGGPGGASGSSNSGSGGSSGNGSGGSFGGGNGD